MDEPSDITLRDWLLGKLAAHEAEALEERLLHDDALGARLQAAETDLLDDVANARLDANDRAAALRVVAATPKDRQRLRIAGALSRLLAEQATGTVNERTSVDALRARKPARTPIWRWPVFAAGALAAACLAVVVVGLQRRESSTLPPSATATLATITLTMDQQRGAAPESIGIARGAAMIRLQVEVDAADPATRYDLRIEDEDRVVFQAHAMTLREVGAYRFVEAAVPSTVLGSGAHTVRVHATGATAPSQTWLIQTHGE